MMSSTFGSHLLFFLLIYLVALAEIQLKKICKATGNLRLTSTMLEKMQTPASTATAQLEDQLREVLTCKIQIFCH